MNTKKQNNDKAKLNGEKTRQACSVHDTIFSDKS